MVSLESNSCDWSRQALTDLSGYNFGGGSEELHYLLLVNVIP